jgi:hypothetical protein
MINESTAPMSFQTAEGVRFAFAVGGFETQLVVFFEYPWELREFTRNGYDATAQAGERLDQEKAEAVVAGLTNVRAVFFLAKRGWKVSATATATGMKYWRDPDLN